MNLSKPKETGNTANNHNAALRTTSPIKGVVVIQGADGRIPLFDALRMGQRMTLEEFNRWFPSHEQKNS